MAERKGNGCGLANEYDIVVVLGCLTGSARGAPRLKVKIAGVAQAEGGSFKGIPFAAAPTGSLRWRGPQPPAHWAGVREALTTIPACVQSVTGNRLPWTPEYLHQDTAAKIACSSTAGNSTW